MKRGTALISASLILSKARGVSAVLSSERRDSLKKHWVFAALLLGSFWCGSAHAQVILNITVDEFGKGVGTIGPGFIAPDPGPGGQAATLTYTLPFVGVVGD